MRRYSFDLTLAGAITVPAATRAEAEAFITALFDCASANVGRLPDGDPAIMELSLADESLADSLYAVFDKDGNEINVED